MSQKPVTLAGYGIHRHSRFSLSTKQGRLSIVDGASSGEPHLKMTFDLQLPTEPERIRQRNEHREDNVKDDMKVGQVVEVFYAAPCLAVSISIGHIDRGASAGG